MRIKLGTHIYLCDFVYNPNNGKILKVNTNYGNYIIVFDTEKEAYEAYEQLLKKGYYDATDKEYK